MLLYATLQSEVEPLLFMARSLALQRSALQLTQAFVERAEQARLSAIISRNEAEANVLLGFSSIGHALGSELAMFILLKEDQGEKAWDKLIDAQDQILAAASASQHFSNLEAKFAHLREMEDHFFPPQVFVSAGLIVRQQHCSICQDDYEKCDHIAGRPYMGRLCSIVPREISADHIAVVKAPADRRCRITTFNDAGGVRNKMTWVLSPRGGEKGNSSAIIAVSAAEEMDVCDENRVADELRRPGRQ